MTQSRTLRQIVVALALMVAFLSQATWVLAGTTGRLSGQVTDDSRCSGRGRGRQGLFRVADRRGYHRRRRTLHVPLPRTRYVHRVGDEGRIQPRDLSGRDDLRGSVADPCAANAKGTQDDRNGRRARFRQPGQIRVRRPTSTRSTRATQTAVQGIGGGGNLNSAYSAIYSQPGVDLADRQLRLRPGLLHPRLGLQPSRVRVRRRSGQPRVRQLQRQLAFEPRPARDRKSIPAARRPAVPRRRWAATSTRSSRPVRSRASPGRSRHRDARFLPQSRRRGRRRIAGSPLLVLRRIPRHEPDVQHARQQQRLRSQPIDGSGPNGIFGFDYNPVAVLFSQIRHRPVVDLYAERTPSGFGDVQLSASRSRPATRMRHGQARAFWACRS